MPIAQQYRNREGQADAERGLGAIQERGGPFVAAVEATRMPMVVTDPAVSSNPIIYANPSFLQLSGYSREDVLGQNYFFLLGEHADPKVAERVEAAIAARHEFVDDVPFRAKDGHELWVAMFVTPVIQDGQVVQHFASFLDVTYRVTRERELREDRETLGRRVAVRTKRLQELNARLHDEIERRQRTEATLRDALAQGQCPSSDDLGQRGRFANGGSGPSGC